MHGNTEDLLEQGYHRLTCRFCSGGSALFVCLLYMICNHATKPNKKQIP